MPNARGLWYEERGPGAAPPILFSAGLGGLGSYWDACSEALVAAGHRVVLYDHRGTGESGRELHEDLTLDDMAEDLWTIASCLGSERITLVGHALGGILGLCVAARAPRLIARVAVVNGLASPDPHFCRCLKSRLALLDVGVREFLQAQPIFLYPAAWSSANSDRLRAEERAQLEHFPGAEIVEARIKALLNFDITPQLARVHQPVLVVAAEDDMLVPSTCSEQLCQSLPASSLVRMTGGHACNITEPERFNRILLGWLAGEAPGGVH